MSNLPHSRNLNELPLADSNIFVMIYFYINQLFSCKNLYCTLIIFCYIFSFYVIGFITSSIIIAIPCLYVCLRDKLFSIDTYTRNIIYFILLIIFTGLLYSIVRTSFDYSYVKVMIAQLIHILVGLFVVTFLRHRYQVTTLDIEKYIVYAYFAQSLIEIIASVTPSLAAALLPFNRAYNFAENEAGRRGLALAAGTGWSLGLSFGLLYIIFVKRYLLESISAGKIFVGVILLAGTMFAGRTGFVGAAFGILLFFLNANKGIAYKIAIVLKILFVIALVCAISYLLFPDLVNHLVENVFPFAFEPFYKLYYNDEFSTGSTDVLQEMWEVVISPTEILIGTGYFTDPLTGSYYMHIDIGILRNLFYWGIVGYVLIIVYQLYILNPIRTTQLNKKERWNIGAYRWCLLCFLFVMEFKAMTIGFNKMALSLAFLLGYFYYYEYKETKSTSAPCISNHSMLQQ